jgi:RND family efflux transporter MFP subunit
MKTDTRDRHRLRLAALGVAALLAGAGCMEEAPAPPAPPPPKVTVTFPEQRDVADDDDFNGWTAAVETVEVRSRVRGQIEQVHFEDGDLVKAGAPLFTLDQRPFEAEVARARSSKLALEAQLVASGKEQARLQELLGKGGASQKQVEKSVADVGALEAQIAAAQSEVDRLALDLEYSLITAPISGRLSRALLTKGNLVDAGGTDPLLTTIVSVDPVQVYFDIPERLVLKYRTHAVATDGDLGNRTLASRKLPFRFGLESDDGYPRAGVLDYADNLMDATTGTLRVRGIAANADGFLVAGARVRVRLAVAEPAPGTVVPERALLADQDRRYVLVVGPDETVLRRDVRPGRLLDDGGRVLQPLPGDDAAGVQPSDRVIIEGQARARIHEKVEALDADGRPVPAAAAPQ